MSQKPLHKLASLLDTFRQLGARNTALWLCSRVLDSLTRGHCGIHRYCFVAQPVAIAQIAPASRARSFVIRLVSRDDALVSQFPRRADVVRRRFDMGAICIAAEQSGVFVGFIWLKEERYSEDEVRCLYLLEPPGAAAWDFDVHIEEQFRSGRAFVRLWDSANAWLREHGYSWTISRISAFNPGSLAAHRRLGIRTVGRATFLRLGDFQIALLRGPPFLHLTWRDNQMPVLRLRAPEASNSYNVIPYSRFGSS